MEPGKPARARGFVVCGVAYVVAGLCAWLVTRAMGEERPVITALAADLAATLVVFLASAAANNTSIYDPYWSVAPPLVGAWWLTLGEGGPRAWLCLGLVLLWSARLTANWATRWRGLGDEDWRYAEHRARPGYWLLSLGGFHLMPTLVVFGGCLSLYPVMRAPGSGLGLGDVLAVAVTLGAIAIEAVADRQLRVFRGSVARGDGAVLSRGLWAASRHPNYFGEILFWWGLWVFGLAADPRWWWTIAGPVAVTLLFVLVSAPMVDRRMESRHPGYLAATRDRSSLVPLPRLRPAKE